MVMRNAEFYLNVNTPSEISYMRVRLGHMKLQ